MPKDDERMIKIIIVLKDEVLVFSMEMTKEEIWKAR
jgi:replicative DNA helicase